MVYGWLWGEFDVFSFTDGLSGIFRGALIGSILGAIVGVTSCAFFPLDKNIVSRAFYGSMIGATVSVILGLLIYRVAITMVPAFVFGTYIGAVVGATFGLANNKFLPTRK